MSDVDSSGIELERRHESCAAVSMGQRRCGPRILMHGLTYHVASNTNRGERAYLLKDISAYFEPNQMTALMGPSGSGKTTLLDLLAGRKTVGKTEGHLSFGGVAPSKPFLRRYTGYVEQFDTLLGDLTVREMLLYTAELKRPMREPMELKRGKVEELLRRLRLESCADLRIGNPLAKGISGGQGKRTNIGIALISEPRVLFLDEPTSGLDSYTAHEVVRVVRGLLQDGTTVAATIHGPTAATFALFDRIMLLARGRMVYFGPRGLPALHYAAQHWQHAAASVKAVLAEMRPADRRVTAASALGAATTATATAAAASEDDDTATAAAAAAAVTTIALATGICSGAGEGLGGAAVHEGGLRAGAAPGACKAPGAAGAVACKDVGAGPHVAAAGAVGAACAPGAGLSYLALNVAEVLVGALTEADHHGGAEELAAAYGRSELRRVNEDRLALYLLAAGVSTSVSITGTGNSSIATGSGGGLQQGTQLPRQDPKQSGPAGSRSSSSRSGDDGGSKDVEQPPDREQQVNGAAAPAPAAPVLSRLTSPLASWSSGLEPDQEAIRELATRSETGTPWYWGLWTLLRYRTSRNYRSPSWLLPRVMDKVIISLIIVTLYWGVGNKPNPNNIVNIQSSLFMWALLPACGAASYVPAIVLERRLFVRERDDGLYRCFTYLAAKLLEEVCLSLGVSVAFSAYVFHGLRLQGQWVVFWLVYFLDMVVGIVLAYLVAALSPNMDVANMALATFVMTLLFFAGQIMTAATMPPWWSWYSRIDFLRYAWGALMVNQFESNDAELTGGITILKYYSLLGISKWAYLGYLSVFFFVFAVMAQLALNYMRHQRR